MEDHVYFYGYLHELSFYFIFFPAPVAWQEYGRIPMGFDANWG